MGWWGGKPEPAVELWWKGSRSASNLIHGVQGAKISGLGSGRFSYSRRSRTKRQHIIMQSQTWVRLESWLHHFLAVTLSQNCCYLKGLLWIFSKNSCKVPILHRVDAQYTAPIISFCGHWGLDISTGCSSHKAGADANTQVIGLFSTSFSKRRAALYLGRISGRWELDSPSEPSQGWVQRRVVVLEC